MKKTDEQKLRETFQSIFDEYAQGEPLDKLISKAGINVFQFYKYIGDNPEAEAEFHKAKNLFTFHQNNSLVTDALHSFRRLITGYTEVEYMEEFVPQYDENGKERSRIVTKRQERTKHFQPSPAMVQLALEKLIPNIYSQPSKLLPEKPRDSVKQVFKIGNQIIDFS
jgi:hypothetical protein